MKSEISSIGSICKKICSGGTPKSTKEEYYQDGTIPWLNTKEICFNRIRTTERKITQSGFENSSAKWIYPPAIVIAMYGATAGSIATVHIPLTTNQACCNLIIDDQTSDYRFIYYYLKWKYKDISSLANGGAQQNLNVKLIKEYSIDLPTMTYQKRVANILWSIDDKIETNNAISKNLEEVLQAVYRQIFSSVLKNTLADVCSYSKERISVNELTVNDYYSTENMLPQKSGATVAENLPTTSQTTKCHIGDVLISNIRPYFKKILYCYRECGCSNDVLCFTPKAQNLSAFLYGTLYADHFFDFMVAGSKGTKMPRGDKQQIMTYPIPLPSAGNLDRYNAVAIPILHNINTNNIENRNLTALRDALLPRLMSGEIDVSGIEV